MSNIFLVDLENVSHGGLSNASKLSKDDEIIIFYSTNVSIDSPGVQAALKGCKAKVTTKEAYICGKNSLDFQLVAYLGTLIDKAKNNTFYIVSHDKDYCSVILFLKDTFDTYLIPTILINSRELEEYKDRSNSQIISEVREKRNKKNIKIKTKEVYEREMIKLGNIQKNREMDFLNVVYDSNNLNEYHNNLKKEFGQKGKELYQETKLIFIKVVNMSPNRRVVLKNTKNITNLRKTSKSSNISFDVVCSIIKESKNKQEYHTELSTIYGRSGINFYNCTKKMFGQVKNDIL